MKHFASLAFAAALLFHTNARAMLRDASVEHDLERIKKSFEVITLSRSGQATDLTTARAVVRDAENPVR